jgi:hypothetical protein
MSTFASSPSDDEMTHAAALAVVAVAVADCEGDADNEDGIASLSAGLQRDAIASRSRTDGWTGRTVGSARNIRRGLCSWEGDYLTNTPIYKPAHFRRRFRIPLKLYRLLEKEIPVAEPDLEQKRDALHVTVPDTWGCYSRGLYSCAHFRSQRTTKQG